MQEAEGGKTVVIICEKDHEALASGDGRPSHPPVAGAQDFRLIDHCKAELFVEAYVLRLVGLQERDLAHKVEICAQCLHHPRAQSLALSADFHGDGTKMPVRLRQVALFTGTQPATQAP